MTSLFSGLPHNLPKSQDTLQTPYPKQSCVLPWRWRQRTAPKR